MGCFCRWDHISNLEWHTSPVLSLASLEMPGNSAAKASNAGCLVVSGATDGSMALWHLQLPGSAEDPDQAAKALLAERLLCMPSLHQSGVNAVSMSFAPGSTGVVLACLWSAHTLLVFSSLLQYRSC